MSGIERFKVVVNGEEQYSLWNIDRVLPAGWVEAGFEGEKDSCLGYIESVWTDMRPRSLRDHRLADGGA
jgi:MbtH protein